MGIGGYVLAGALQGAGNAITQQAQSDAEARRQIALQNLKAQDARSSAMFQAQINDAADATKQARANKYAIDLAGVKTDQQIRVDTNRGNISATNDAANDARDFTHATALENLRTRNDLSKADHDAAIDAVKANTQINDVQTLASGQLVGVTKTGETIALKGRGANGKPIYLATAKPGQKGGDDSGGATVGAAMAGRSGGTPAPSAPAAAPVRGIGVRAQNGTPAGGAAVANPFQNNEALSADETFALGQRVGQPTYLGASYGGTTYTMAQLREAAQAKGISIEQARAEARRLGFTLTQ